MKQLFLALALFLLSGMSAHAANPQVEIKTNRGTIVCELYPDKAPRTVENFLQYIKDDFYSGTIFHRVIPGFMIQGGGFTKEYAQKPTRAPIENEATNGLKNDTGTIAMARTSQPHSATAQFFINVADNAFLNYTGPTVRGYGYAVFGKVTKGMDVIAAIAETPTGPGGPFPKDAPTNMVIIESATVVGAGR